MLQGFLVFVLLTTIWLIIKVVKTFGQPKRPKIERMTLEEYEALTYSQKVEKRMADEEAMAAYEKALRK